MAARLPIIANVARKHGVHTISVISSYRDWAYFRPRLFLASFRKEARFYDELTYRMLLVETLPGL